jgi:hypothetical protein
MNSFPENHKNINSLSKIQHKWAIGEAQYRGVPLIIRYSETAKEWLSHPELSVKLGFAIPLSNPIKKDLSRLEENSIIDAIEDIICREVFKRAVGLQALALTTDKVKELVFYIRPGADIAEIHAIVQQQVSTHEIQCLATKEPGWDSYKEFTPR